MRWSKRTTTVIIAIGALLISGTGTASASQDIGWIYTSDLCGSAYFDADYAGHAGEERLMVLDRCGDGRGAVASLYYGGVRDRWLTDPNSEGGYRWAAGNWYPEDRSIYLQVCLYAGGTDNYNCSSRILGET